MEGRESQTPFLTSPSNGLKGLPIDRIPRIQPGQVFSGLFRPVVASAGDLLPIDECQKAISVARHWVMMNPLDESPSPKLRPSYG